MYRFICYHTNIYIDKLQNNIINNNFPYEPFVKSEAFYISETPQPGQPYDISMSK